jgi:hypothetical protein
MFGVFRDEKEMLATVECHKQKDGELFDDVTFGLATERLGTDEDGEAVTSLVASALTSSDQLLAAHQAEAAAGRQGRASAFRELLQSGQSEKELRHSFYKTLDGMDADAKKHAYYRARDAALRAGMFEFGTVQGSAERIVIIRSGQ